MLLIDLVLVTPFVGGVEVDVREGLRFTPGDGEPTRPVEAGGGGFFVAAVDISWDQVRVCEVVNFWKIMPCD